MTNQKLLREVEAARREVQLHEARLRWTRRGMGVSFAMILIGIAWGAVGITLGLNIAACAFLLPFGSVAAVGFSIWNHLTNFTAEATGYGTTRYTPYDPRPALADLEDRYYASLSGA